MTEIQLVVTLLLFLTFLQFGVLIALGMLIKSLTRKDETEEKETGEDPADYWKKGKRQDEI